MHACNNLIAGVVHHGCQVTLVPGAAGAHLTAARRRMGLAMPPQVAPVLD